MGSDPSSSMASKGSPFAGLRALRPSRWLRVEPGSDPAQAGAAEAAPRPTRPYLDMFLISFLILFFELGCIRYFGSTVIFLTFFTNLVLMACFLGMSVGCLAASRKRDLITTVIPLALVAVSLAGLVLYVYTTTGKIHVDVGGQGSPQQIFFGTEYLSKDISQFVVPIEVLAGTFFALIALVFVGLGQVMGRAFNAISNRVGAYTVNVAGSLAGIVAFALASLFRLPPYAWFSAAMALCIYFLPRLTKAQGVCAIALLLVVAYQAHWEGTQHRTSWSPYYKITYDADSGFITTNNIGHQGMVDLTLLGGAYHLPHLLNRDAGGPSFKDVMIIGAGSGNDVQAALMNGAEHVDAVEIDPVIQSLGAADHPNKPYDDPRVHVHLDDGRSFVRKTERKYDLIVYALVDSLVLHSGYSSLRLESFLFTEQAFRDIKAKLKPGGVFVMYNYYRQGWVVGRLDKLCHKVFGTAPVALAMPHVAEIKPSDNLAGRISCLMAGDPGSVGRIRDAFQREGPFWLYDLTEANARPGFNGYGHEKPQLEGTWAPHWKMIAPAWVNSVGSGRTPSDNWPFLYLRQASIPGLNWRGMAVIAAISLAILFAFAPVRTARPNPQMFFLGAGFMLLETKGVVHMALLFGSTWAVNSIVFMAILVMILLSNLFVIAVKPKVRWPYYIALLVALLVNTLVPMETFLALPGAARMVASCAVTFVPIFFAGIIFATLLRDSRQPDVDLGSNIGGAILGGLSENFALMLGFEHLMLVAIAFYALSALLRWRSPVPAAIPSAA